jgi:hypothetical protein
MRPAFSKAYYFGSLLTEKYPHLRNTLIREGRSGN